MQSPVRPKPTDAMLPTSTWFSLAAEPSVRARSRMIPVAGLVCSQKNAKARRDTSSRKSASAGYSVAAVGFGATVGATGRHWAEQAHDRGDRDRGPRAEPDERRADGQNP